MRKDRCRDLAIVCRRREKGSHEKAAMSRRPVPARTADVQAGYSPLYRRVKKTIVDRMIAGDWTPGAILPSEIQLGEQMGVSQGTVRKALDELAAENIVVRHQGRGTFVAVHDQNRTLFQFFKLVDADGHKSFPETVFSEIHKNPANADERARLDLPAGAKVWRVGRHRALNGRVTLIERIALSTGRFPRLNEFVPLPNNIYQLFERQFGVTITRAVESLRAISADKASADVLGCAEGAPLLRIDRLAYGLDGTVAEFRRSDCLTTEFSYLSDLT